MHCSHKGEIFSVGSFFLFLFYNVCLYKLRWVNSSWYSALASQTLLNMFWQTSGFPYVLSMFHTPLLRSTNLDFNCKKRKKVDRFFCTPLVMKFDICRELTEGEPRLSSCSYSRRMWIEIQPTQSIPFTVPSYRHRSSHKSPRARTPP